MTNLLPHPNPPEYSGFFITFEGGDWVGKSTQIVLLAEVLQKTGVEVLVTREPGGTSLGKQLRQAIQHGETLDARTEALLYAADRAHHTHSLVLPHLQRGVVVLGDRYLDSSIAYQGAARKLGIAEIQNLSLWATGGLIPDLTVLLDGNPETLRQQRAGNSFDRIEQEPLAFHHAVRAQYQQLVQQDTSGRFTVFNAQQPVNALHQQITKQVMERLSAANLLPSPIKPHPATRNTSG